MEFRRALVRFLIPLFSGLFLSCGAPLSRVSKPVADIAASRSSSQVHYVKRPDSQEKIIGANDLEPVVRNGDNLPQKYRPLIDAFGLISTGCTATHIGNGLVITAGHCFEAPKARKDKVDCRGKWIVRWGLRKDSNDYLVSNCKTILAYENNDDRDYAIFVVDKIPSVAVELDLETNPPVGRKVTIFGHPQSRPLEWSKVCTVEPGSNGKYGKDQFSHQCDTEFGNSGSTIIDDETLKIVGIHGGGLDEWNYGTFILATPVLEILNLEAPAFFMSGN